MNFQYLILTPLKAELDPLITFLANHTTLTPTMTNGRTGYFCEELNAFFGFAGHGKVDFALHASLLLQRFTETRQLIVAGAGGALDQNHHIGDIAVGVETVEHDYKERFFKAQNPSFKGHSGLVEHFNVQDYCFKAKILSGDEDIVDAERSAELKKEFGADMVAWEGAGGARAAALHDCHFLELRGVTDHADHSAAKSFKKNLKLSMQNIGRLILTLKDIE